jgi:hypothetical protein
VRALVAVWLLAGCDVLFKIKQLDEPPDALSCGSPDEDSDCIADDIDNCPGTPNAQQVVTAEDATPSGVGDACDPEPTIPGDVVKRFIGFNDPLGDPAAWEPVTSWTFRDGVVAKNLATQFGIVRQLEVDDDDVLAVEAAFVYQGGDIDADRRMAVWVDIPLGDAYAGQTCWVSTDGNRVFEQERMETPGGGGTEAVDITPLQPGDVIQLRLLRERTAGTMRCSATINGSTITLPTLVASGPWLTGGHIGIQAQRVLADVRYVTLYAR